MALCCSSHADHNAELWFKGRFTSETGFCWQTRKSGLICGDLRGAVAQKCVNAATWLWIRAHLRARKVQTSMPIYVELSPRTSEPRGASVPTSCSGWPWLHPANPRSVMLFHKAALTCRLSWPSIVCCGVWDTHPETCGANET